MSPAEEGWNPNYWTARESPCCAQFKDGEAETSKGDLPKTTWQSSRAKLIPLMGTGVCPSWSHGLTWEQTASPRCTGPVREAIGLKLPLPRAHGEAMERAREGPKGREAEKPVTATDRRAP